MKRSRRRSTGEGCGRARRLLSDRLDGLLEPDDLEWVDHHVAACGPCREAARGLCVLSAAATDLAVRDRCEWGLDLTARVMVAIAPKPVSWGWLLPARFTMGLSVAFAALLVFAIGLPDHLSLPAPPVLGIGVSPVGDWSGPALPSITVPVTPAPPPVMSLIRRSLIEEVPQ